MTDETQTLTPLKKFVYPFQMASAGGQGASTATEVVDPQTYYSALAKAEDGFYPIGANGQWHGGIHFGSQTGTALAQDAGIRCIADGEVIAYRIDGSYPTVAYDSCGPATYSTGFALVRHRLQLPPAPKKSGAAATDDAANGAQNTQKDEEPSLLLYSLYMHLHHWEGYRADTKKARPAYWGDAVYAVAESANDADRGKSPHIPEGGIGLNLRDADGKIAGYAPRGVKLTLGGEGKKKGYYAVTGVVSGEVVPAGLTGAYAYKKELTETTADPATDRVVVLDKPIGVKAGDLMGHLGQYQRYVDTNPLGASCSERPLVQLDVFTCDDVEAFIAKSRERAGELDEKHKTLLLIEAGAKLALPTKADQQIAESDGVVLDATSPKTGQWAKVRKGAVQVVAKAGLTGYTPATRTYSNGNVLSRVVDASGNAIEVDAYNALSAAGKAAYTQREVMVPSGDAVWVERGMLGEGPLMTGRSLEAWSRFPLTTGDTTGPQAALPRVVAVKSLNETALEADGTRWWRLVVGASDGSGQAGWAREKGQAKVRLCTPWDWPGFELVTADDITPATLYANHVAKHPRTPKDEQSKLEAQGASAESSQLFTKLYELIDLDADKKLVATEIRKALSQPWLAEAISRLIVRHDSEWAGPMDKWDALDELIPEARKADWVQEKKRIESLLWWSNIKLKEKSLAENVVSYFHPVGMVLRFADIKRHPEITLDGEKVELEFLDFYDGLTLSDSDYETAAAELGCETAAIKAVSMSESGASGSYFKFVGSDIVPAILYERHYFHRETDGKYDSSHPELSNSAQSSSYGNYLSQYRKLLSAYALDKEAALKSCSWGRFQIMGKNHVVAGHDAVEAFVTSISKSERYHLSAFVSFIKSNKNLSSSIVEKDWLKFAINYNGSGQKGYDKSMRDNYESLSK